MSPVSQLPDAFEGYCYVIECATLNDRVHELFHSPSRLVFPTREFATPWP